jgi:AcrR family transcriptional regulator
MTQVERTEKARARIIDAAFMCLAAKGYQNTTLIEIARVAGCSRELPRYHFGTKEQLMEVLVDEIHHFSRDIFDELAASNANGPDALGRVAEWIAEQLKQGSPQVRGFGVLVFSAVDPSHDALQKKIAANQQRTRAAFRGIILKHMRANREVRRLDPDAIIALVYSIFRGFTYQWLIDSDSVSIDAMVLEFKRICPILLGG